MPRLLRSCFGWKIWFGLLFYAVYLEFEYGTEENTWLSDILKLEGALEFWLVFALLFCSWAVFIVNYFVVRIWLFATGCVFVFPGFGPNFFSLFVWINIGSSPLPDAILGRSDWVDVYSCNFWIYCLDYTEFYLVIAWSTADDFTSILSYEIIPWPCSITFESFTLVYVCSIIVWRGKSDDAPIPFPLSPRFK